MPKLSITRWDTSAIIYAAEAPDIKTLLECAVADNLDCYGARLDGARLDGASLDGARLVGARLVGARLDGASLVRARLDGASLVRARLDGASLVRARLVRARLDGASLVRASLDGAKYGAHEMAGPLLQIGNLAEWRTGLIAWQAKDSGLRIICGCRDFSIAEARAHWAERKDRPKTRLALDLAELWYESL